MSKKDEIKKIIDEALFIDVDLDMPKPVITIDNSTIAYCGNFITINGLPKSRKTTIMQFFIYCAISGVEYLGIKVNINPNDKIILIDTEQSIYDFSKQISGLKYLLKTKKLPSQFSAYLFRKYEPNVILNSIYELVIKEKPKLLFIDNITELCINVNDMSEAKAVIQFLKKISFETNCVIVCLLHLGKGNQQTLGNLGSMADRGAQSVLKVTYDKETNGSILEPVFLRSAMNFEPITIVYNTDTKMYEKMNDYRRSSGNKKKLVLDDLKPVDYYNRLSVIFMHQKELMYAELIEQIKQIFGCGITIAKTQVIPYLIGNKYIQGNKGIYTQI